MSCNEAFEMLAFNSTLFTSIPGVITLIDGKILVTTVVEEVRLY
jgi:hypothetical protein